jgi:serine phosphatase RsbU (regulator of sigma subunit)
MSWDPELIEKLTTLNHIGESLNQAVDVRNVLDRALADLVELMDLETGWIMLKDPPDQEGTVSSGFQVAAHCNLPPALDLENKEVWNVSCTCRDLCQSGRLTQAYNEVHCSRLSRGHGDRRGLAVHASVPLRSGDHTLGILNVAAPDWDSFTPQALSLLTSVGNQMGIALERAQLYDLLRERRIHEQAALLHFSNQLLSRLELDDLIEYLVKEMQQVLGADACALLLPSDEPDCLEFRASTGWRQDPGADRRRVPADERSGPGLTMCTQQPLFVEDIQETDPTPWAPAWVQAEGFRGHAVVPLLVNNHSLGVLVINQRKPRLLSKDDVRYLQLMANQAALALEKARLHEEEVRMRAMEKELEVGRQIQLSLLPGAPPVVPGWEFAIFYQAAREVGGDFYDIFALPDSPDRLGIVVADVTGKGVPAALFMARNSKVIRTNGLHFGSPAAALVESNESILRDQASGLLLTALYAVLDTGSGRLVFANAGHCRPIWLQAATGQSQELVSRGILLGALDGIELEEREIHLEPGDLLVFYTDGISEALNSEREFFGEERLEAVLAAAAGGSAQQVLQAIVDAVWDFAGNTAQSDDLTLFVARRTPLPA